MSFSSENVEYVPWCVRTFLRIFLCYRLVADDSPAHTVWDKKRLFNTLFFAGYGIVPAYAFVRFGTTKECHDAITQLNGKAINGRTMRVEHRNPALKGTCRSDGVLRPTIFVGPGYDST